MDVKSSAYQAIVTVAHPNDPNAKGLGFVAAGGFVVTAAHNLPPAENPSGLYDYEKLLVRLTDNEQGDSTPVFVDLCSDLAVLAPADEDSSFAQLLSSISPLAIVWSPLLVQNPAGGVFTHDRGLVEASYNVNLSHLVSFSSQHPIQAGTSGAPVFDCMGAVLGVVSRTCSSNKHRDGWGPLLSLCLPAWLAQKINAQERQNYRMPNSAVITAPRA